MFGLLINIFCTAFSQSSVSIVLLLCKRPVVVGYKSCCCVSLNLLSFERHLLYHTDSQSVLHCLANALQRSQCRIDGSCIDWLEFNYHNAPRINTSASSMLKFDSSRPFDSHWTISDSHLISRSRLSIIQLSVCGYTFTLCRDHTRVRFFSEYDDRCTNSVIVLYKNTRRFLEAASVCCNIRS